MELVVTDLACARGGVPLLEGVSFTLRAGEALALTGPNGSGKTTFLRTLAGLQPPLRGTIDGAADQIAYAGHADGLKATLSVAENLSFWAAIHGTAEIAGTLAALNLTRLAERPAHTLSAGQKRRLGLARLLVTNRWLWLMDEPTVSLDTASVELFRGILRAHLAAGGAAIVATHIDLGLDGARHLDTARHKARLPVDPGFDEAFL